MCTITRTKLTDKVRSEVILERAGLKSLTEAVSVTMATLIWKARKEMNTLGFIFENKSSIKNTRSKSVTNYGNPYQDTQNWLQIRWRKSGITLIWAMLSLLRVLRHLLLNGIGRIQKFDSLYDVIILVLYYFTFS